MRKSFLMITKRDIWPKVYVSITLYLIKAIMVHMTFLEAVVVDRPNARNEESQRANVDTKEMSS